MKYEIHELALVIPAMLDSEYTQLKADIEANGLMTPITLFENQVLDGRHRYQACQELGIEPDYTTLKEDANPLLFVVSANVKRRHLTPTQLAKIAHELSKDSNLGGDRQSEEYLSTTSHHVLSQEDAATMTGASLTSIKKAKKVAEDNPDLYERMGEVGFENEDKPITVNSAYNKIKTKKRQEEAKARQAERENAPRAVPDAFTLYHTPVSYTHLTLPTIYSV